MTNALRRLEIMYLSLFQMLDSIKNPNVKNEITILLGKINSEVTKAKEKLKSREAQDLKGSPAYTKYQERVFFEMKNKVAELIAAGNYYKRVSNLKSMMILKPEQLTSTQELLKALRFKEIRDDIRRENVNKNELQNTFLDDCRSGVATDFVHAMITWPGSLCPLSSLVLENGKQLLGELANPETSTDLKNLQAGIAVVEDFKKVVDAIN